MSSIQCTCGNKMEVSLRVTMEGQYCPECSCWVESDLVGTTALIELLNKVEALEAKASNTKLLLDQVLNLTSTLNNTDKRMTELETKQTATAKVLKGIVEQINSLIHITKIILRGGK